MWPIIWRRLMSTPVSFCRLPSVHFSGGIPSGADGQRERMMALKTDVKEEIMRGSGPGGSSVNTSMNCIRLTHLPTGISVRVHDTQLLSQNRKIAWRRLQEKIDSQMNGMLTRAEKRAIKNRCRKERRQRRYAAKMREKEAELQARASEGRLEDDAAASPREPSSSLPESTSNSSSNSDLDSLSDSESDSRHAGSGSTSETETDSDSESENEWGTGSGSRMQSPVHRQMGGDGWSGKEHPGITLRAQRSVQAPAGGAMAGPEMSSDDAGHQKNSFSAHAEACEDADVCGEIPSAARPKALSESQEGRGVSALGTPERKVPLVKLEEQRVGTEDQAPKQKRKGTALKELDSSPMSLKERMQAILEDKD
uniref:Prokaryotic-type class I peptide chain release factors domain-containing protein n=1 Tax=Chromera velia CCMP2878 TaxID=1169474 RepID=A0A0G4FJL8_9ALVE|eukprot:Cvel_17204.t1-p1 / transcript=Cvel_17204.t1 / gene=Cvel_17204 / organism=Chromera_velia_CCMP2878 / gene_product=Probable peptide chain release factor C12orf65, putative / transcript_product=Probable peptide chain release factor C12orf65, putative / location=Cvel_scaffold1360:28545-32076(+) / protein_length=366 / sequence_SO=supercontig / SO=protein_coding / is_pseudo=false